MFNLTSLTTVRSLLRQYHILPRKSLGQNFLIDQNILNKIIETADLSPSDVILEVGGGLGTLTQELAKRVKEVICVEKDKRLTEILKMTTTEFQNVEIKEGDILKMDFRGLKNYKIVANLPFEITSPVLWRFLNQGPRPKEMILMVQKEVAERMMAKKGEMNLLALLVQFYGSVEMIKIVSKSCFFPQPKVDSAIIKIKVSLSATLNPGVFFQFLKAGFSAKRKLVANNLAKFLSMKSEKTREIFIKNQLNPFSRAQDLNLADWLRLFGDFMI